MNREQLEEASLWNSLLTMIEKYNEYREDTATLRYFPFSRVFESVHDTGMKKEILTIVEQHARKKLAECCINENEKGVEKRIDTRLKHAEQKIKKLEERLEKWWSLYDTLRGK